MADLNEAFNTSFTHDITSKKKSIKTNNRIIGIYENKNKVYGYICTKCNGCLNYHNSIQDKQPHEFSKGQYRELYPFEQGPFYNGIPLLN